jgi:predicted membrane channel-forming protein YqfA (hemolysin III family)
VRDKLKTSCFVLLPVALFVISLETDILVFFGSAAPFYILYLLSTLKASEFSAASKNSIVLLLFLISHISMFIIYGVTGFIGFLMHYLFHEINKRSLNQMERFAKLSYGASYVAKKATGEDSQKLSNYDMAITIVALAVSFAFYFTSPFPQA